MRLIDADAYEYPGDLVWEPTIDAVAVVRCKDCKFFGYEIKPSTQEHSCRNYSLPYCKPDDFCSYGERKKSNV